MVLKIGKYLVKYINIHLKMLKYSQYNPNHSSNNQLPIVSLKSFKYIWIKIINLIFGIIKNKLERTLSGLRN